jgi:hypothetical protein
MLWWHWVVVGFILAALEMLTPGGFFIMFFGVGAFVVGMLALVGLGGPQWLQWLLFCFFSIVSLLLFREPLLRRVRATLPPADSVDSLVGEPVLMLEDIAPGAVGRGELRGTTWAVRNSGTTTVAKGGHCRVIEVDGTVLCVRQEGGA